jgi:hypothetical protein
MARVCVQDHPVLYRSNGCEGPDWYQAGDSSIYPAYAVMEDDADEVKVCATNGAPIGIAGCQSYHDLNTAFTAGKRLPVWRIGCGATVWSTLDGNATETLDKGALLLRSANTAGTLDLGATAVIEYVGRLYERTTTAAGTKINCRVMLIG